MPVYMSCRGAVSSVLVSAPGPDILALRRGDTHFDWTIWSCQGGVGSRKSLSCKLRHQGVGRTWHDQNPIFSILRV
jgi:hypothetical protein